MRKKKKNSNGMADNSANRSWDITIAPRPVAGNSARIVEKLSSMPLSETLRVWHNATIALSDPKKAHLKADASKVLTAIDREWKRRGGGRARPEDWFKWPGTQASMGGRPLAADWLDEGVLKYLGYQVGKSSNLVSPLRAAILDRVFSGQLPPVFPPQYLADWGAPASAGRLRKIVESIAAFTRNAKRRSDQRLDQAILDWEHDLKFLHDTYYFGRFRFTWPATL
jgi:hypothetical protein